VRSVDEKTSLQPRPRSSPTLPAQLNHLPTRLEHEYKRVGALDLFAAYDRKRPAEFMAFLEHLDREIPEAIRTIHLVCDHVSTHHGKEVTRWIPHQPRFVVHFTPVHGSWMNQVEQ
jgi:transposase